MRTEVDLSPYVFRFAFVYALALIGIGVILALLEIEGASLGSVAALFAGVAVAVTRFVKEQKRVPAPKERKRLTWLSLLASFAVSFALAVILVIVTGQLSLVSELPSLIAEAGLPLLVGVIFLVALLYALVLWLAYGWFAKMQLNAMERNTET